MSHIISIILAKTPEEREAAQEALRRHNAKLPSDREMIANFLKDCTSLDGAPLTLADSGAIVPLQ